MVSFFMVLEIADLILTMAIYVLPFKFKRYIPLPKLWKTLAITIAYGLFIVMTGWYLFGIAYLIMGLVCQLVALTIAEYELAKLEERRKSKVTNSFKKNLKDVLAHPIDGIITI